MKKDYEKRITGVNEKLAESTKNYEYFQKLNAYISDAHDTSSEKLKKRDYDLE